MTIYTLINFYQQKSQNTFSMEQRKDKSGHLYSIESSESRLTFTENQVKAYQPNTSHKQTDHLFDQANIILTQIENIQDKLKQKKANSYQKKQFIQKEEQERKKIIGKIYSKNKSIERAYEQIIEERKQAGLIRNSSKQNNQVCDQNKSLRSKSKSIKKYQYLINYDTKLTEQKVPLKIRTNEKEMNENKNEKQVETTLNKQVEEMMKLKSKLMKKRASQQESMNQSKATILKSSPKREYQRPKNKEVSKQTSVKDSFYGTIYSKDVDLLTRTRISSSKRQEILIKASSEARLRVEEIQRKVLNRMNSRSNLAEKYEKKYPLDTQQNWRAQHRALKNQLKILQSTKLSRFSPYH